MTISPNINTRVPFPAWLKVASVVGVIWYAFGLLQFWLGYTMDTSFAVDAGTITVPHKAAIDARPLLVWAMFALASGAGLVGSVLLFTRSPAAKAAFALSAVSAIVYYVWLYMLSGTGADLPLQEGVIAAVVIAVTLGFLLVSRRVS